MRSVSDEVIWAGIASIVCGLLIASLLGGTWTPWILAVAVLVLVLGLVVMTTRRRRRQRVLRAYYEPVHRDDPERNASRAAQQESPIPARTPKSRTILGSDPAAVRRAGVRSRSLSTKPSAGESDRLP